MECRHGAMAKPERPRTVIKFTREEVATALWQYAASHRTDVPTGELYVWGIENDHEPELCIERAEGQETWPPEEAK